MTAAVLQAPHVPPGWVAVAGMGMSILAELDATDVRLPHLRAAVDSGRFDDALAALGRNGGPPSVAAAHVVGAAVRVVVAKGAYADALVAGRRREVRPVAPYEWADVTLTDVAAVVLLPMAPAPMPAAPMAEAPPASSASPAPPASPGAPAAYSSAVSAPSSPYAVPHAVPPAPAAGGPIDHLPWETAAPAPAPTPAPTPATQGPVVVTNRAAGGWVPSAPPIPTRPVTPYAAPLPPPSVAPPAPAPAADFVAELPDFVARVTGSSSVSVADEAAGHPVAPGAPPASTAPVAPVAPVAPIAPDRPAAQVSSPELSAVAPASHPEPAQIPAPMPPVAPVASAPVAHEVASVAVGGEIAPVAVGGDVALGGSGVAPAAPVMPVAPVMPPAGAEPSPTSSPGSALAADGGAAEPPRPRVVSRFARKAEGLSLIHI